MSKINTYDFKISGMHTMTKYITREKLCQVSKKERKEKKKKKEGKLTAEEEKYVCVCVYVSVCVFVFVIGTVRNQCQCKDRYIPVEEITHRKDRKN